VGEQYEILHTKEDNSVRTPTPDQLNPSNRTLAQSEPSRPRATIE